jgi:hypothetical protein
MGANNYLPAVNNKNRMQKINSPKEFGQWRVKSGVFKERS